MKDWCPDCQGYGGKRVKGGFEHCESCGGLGFLGPDGIALRSVAHPPGAIEKLAEAIERMGVKH